MLFRSTLMETQDHKRGRYIAKRKLRNEPRSDVVVYFVLRWLIGTRVDEEGAEVTAAIYNALLVVPF